MNIEKINRRAARGAKLLDGKRPGWHRIVNGDILDAQDAEYCVLGQQDGYLKMTDELFGHIEMYSDRRREYARHGFDISHEAYNKENVTKRFRALNAAWRCEITERLNAECETTAARNVKDPDSVTLTMTTREAASLMHILYVGVGGDGIGANGDLGKVMDALTGAFGFGRYENLSNAIREYSGIMVEGGAGYPIATIRKSGEEMASIS